MTHGGFTRRKQREKIFMPADRSPAWRSESAGARNIWRPQDASKAASDVVYFT